MAKKKKTAAEKQPSSQVTKEQLAKVRKLLNNESTVDLGCELLITLRDPAVYEASLKNCSVDTDSGLLKVNQLFRHNQEWRTRALIRVLGTAPEGCSLRGTNIERLNLSSVEGAGSSGTPRQFAGVQDSILTELPVEIGKFTNLKSLSIDNTLIREIPASLAELANLEYLSISYSDSYFRLAYPGSGGYGTGRALLTKLPSQIGQLANLRELRLSLNSIKNVPSEIGDLKSLRKLDLSGNTLRTLPESIGKLLKLETLDLSNTSLTGLPDSIGNLSKLETLDLSNTSLTELPVAIGKLESLETLSLPDTIREIPKELGHLTNLRNIEMAGDFDSDPVTHVILGLCRQILALER